MTIFINSQLYVIIYWRNNIISNIQIIFLWVKTSNIRVFQTYFCRWPLFRIKNQQLFFMLVRGFLVRIDKNTFCIRSIPSGGVVVGIISFKGFFAFRCALSITVWAYWEPIVSISTFEGCGITRIIFSIWSKVESPFFRWICFRFERTYSTTYYGPMGVSRWRSRP